MWKNNTKHGGEMVSVTVIVPATYEALRAHGFLLARGITTIEQAPPPLIDFLLSNGIEVAELTDLSDLPFAAANDEEY